MEVGLAGAGLYAGCSSQGGTAVPPCCSKGWQDVEVAARAWVGGGTCWSLPTEAGAQGGNGLEPCPPISRSAFPCLTAILLAIVQGTVFDYYVDEQACCMAHWSSRVPQFTYCPETLSSVFVPTVETVRMTYLLDLLMTNKHHVMFVGSSGTGKTAIMRDKLRSLDPDAVATYTINMNSQHDGPSLQTTLEAPLEKKAGGWWQGLGQAEQGGGAEDMLSHALCSTQQSCCLGLLVQVCALAPRGTRSWCTSLTT